MLAFKRLIIFIVSLALFMDVLDSNIINTSIPNIAKTLQVNPIDLKIALISYLLSLAVFIPISGWTADRFGTKRIFIAAFGLFTLSSFMCGYSSTLFQLVIARCIQGVGGAFMISLGRLILVRAFQRHELVDAMNTVIIGVSVAVMIGPFIGGFITDHWSWPWIFWVNIPIGLTAILLASIVITDNAPKKTIPLDIIGFILFGSAIALFCLSLSLLSESKINLNYILILFSTSFGCLIAYYAHSKHQAYPIIKVSLFQIRTFKISVLGNIFSRLGFGGIPFLLPLMQQLALGFSAELSGLLLTPIAFGIVFSKLIALKILRKIGYRTYLIINTIFVALSLWSFELVNTHTSVYIIAILTFILGVFLSTQFTGMNSLAFADLSEDQLSASTSITSTVQIFAQSLGVAMAAVLLRYYASSTHLLSIQVFHEAIFTLGILTLLSTAIFINLKKEDGHQMLLKKDL